jgi:hypothetical protein
MAMGGRRFDVGQESRAGICFSDLLDRNAAADAGI